MKKKGIPGKKIWLWVLTVFFAMAALVYLPHISGFAALVVAALAAPIEKWQNIVGKVLKGKGKAAAITVLALLTLLIAPSAETPDGDLPSDAATVTTEQTTGSTQETTIKLEEAAQAGTEDTTEETTQATTESAAEEAAGETAETTKSTTAASEPESKPATESTTEATTDLAAATEQTTEPTKEPVTEATTEPTTEPTQEPSTTPTTEPVTIPTTEATEAVDDGITFTYWPETISRNETGTVKIKGKPNTVYTITVYYKSGASTADGLEAKTSDSEGYVTWSWKVGGKTSAGTFRIVVSGGGESKTVYFTVEV